MLGRWLALGVVSAVLVCPASASARESAISPPEKRAASGSGPRGTVPARSIGSPTDGRLEGAKELVAGKAVRLRNPSARWGLPRLVGLLERSASKLSRRFDGAVLLVGDLSRKEGGDIGGHNSHESGRDADVAFQFVGPDGKSVVPNEFMTVRRDGHAVEQRSYVFDDERNWALVESWVTDRSARVEHIFVAEWLRARLLRHAREKGTYLPVLHRAALALKQPSRGLSHDDHFHVRIACPPGQKRSCISRPKRVEKERQTLPAAVPASRSKATRSALVKRRKQGETTRR